MKIITSIKSIRKVIATCRKAGKRIGFVPTMGALHNGHLSLIRKCHKNNHIVIVSIFVNPMQFGPKEDYTSYPRQKSHDCALAKEAGADIIFYPSVKTMYPVGTQTTVTVPELSQRLCGKSRPGHFDGVATVVSKLFNIVLPDEAYFGQKDYQQIAIIKQMTKDLNMPITIKTVPTIREQDGLAMSSRNAYLSVQHRKEAAMLYQSLIQAKKEVCKGERKTKNIISLINRRIKSTSGKIDYIECVDTKTLKTIRKFKGSCLIALAVYFGKARLIDNILLQIQ